MINSLERLIDGMIATLRGDVIPHIEDPYARGQAVGVIDLLNNIAPRVEWAHALLVAANDARANALTAAQTIIGEAADAPPDPEAPPTAADLIAERDRLDHEIAALVTRLMENGPDDERHRRALALLYQHMNDELEEELRLTRRPLFAEIAQGSRAANQPG